MAAGTPPAALSNSEEENLARQGTRSLLRPTRPGYGPEPEPLTRRQTRPGEENR
jgi:hypothetical protein